MKILYAYPYYGELGWYLFQWAPHIRHMHESKGPFDHSYSIVRTGYEGALSDIVDEFDLITEHEDCTEGNAFVLSRPDAYDFYKAHCKRCDKHVAKLQKSGHEVVTVRLPLQTYRYHRFKERHRKYVRLVGRQDYLDRWKDKIDSNAVILHARNISRSPKKNTRAELIDTVADWAESHGRQFVLVGKTSGYKLQFKPRGLNLIDQTDLDDIIAIFNLGGLVVGSSSGPMHLASLTCTPHVVWGGGRKDVKQRYLEEWNPFQTDLEYISMNFAVTPQALKKSLRAITNRL